MTSSNDQELTLSITNVLATPLETPGVLQITLETTRGPIEAILHPSEGQEGVVMWCGGARRARRRPGSLQETLSQSLVQEGVSSLRLDYRIPGEFEEGVMDSLAALSFLKGIGATKVALVGVSFGGAVAIKAGSLHPLTRGVVAISSQSYGAQNVDQLYPQPILLLHGDEDAIVPLRSAENIFHWARNPKQLIIYPGGGHGLQEVRNEVEPLLKEWLLDKVGPSNNSAT